MQQRCSTAGLRATGTPLWGTWGPVDSLRQRRSASSRDGLYLISSKSIHSSVCGIRNGLFSGLGWSSRERKRNSIALISEEEISLNRIMGLIGSWIACKETSCSPVQKCAAYLFEVKSYLNRQRYWLPWVGEMARSDSIRSALPGDVRPGAVTPCGQNLRAFHPRAAGSSTPTAVSRGHIVM